MRNPIKLRPGFSDKEIQRVLENTHLILNGGVNYGGIQNGVFVPGTQSLKGHIDNVHVKVTFPNPGDVDVTVTHNLGRIPTGYKLVATNNPITIYTGGIQPTTTQITLRGHLLAANVTTAVLEIY